MQNQTEIAKISRFLALMSPVIAGLPRMLIEAAGMQIEEKGAGMELEFIIKSKDKQVSFYLHNLFLEVATIDRDEEPLRFDERLEDFDYLVDKIIRCTCSKLKVLFLLLGEKDPAAAVEKILQQADEYQRIQVWRFDQADSS